MGKEDKCLSENTSSGQPCQWNESKKGECPWHSENMDTPDNGRDPKLTNKRQESIASMIERGNSVTAAARSNGVNKSTIYNWIGKGKEQNEGIYKDFYDRFTRARGHGEKSYLETIRDIAVEEGDTQMLMSLMKQRYPESWEGSDNKSSGSVTIEITEEVAETWTEIEQ